MHSFIIKVWLEETLDTTDRVVWRGHITHVPTGERRYVQHLGDIVAFIVTYLQMMGVKFSIGTKLWLRLRC